MAHRNLSLVLLGLMLLGTAAAAEEAIPGRPLITAAVDEHQTVTLEGNTRPEATAANDRGRLADDFPLEHMHLQLKRSPAQERAVEAYVNGLTERGAPQFHRWLSAPEFGARFGVAQEDIDQIAGWLRSRGFAVNFVYPSRMVIDFSGTAGEVARAFHTEMHRLEVAGVPHIANMGDPRIPAALAPAVEGVVALHDFRAHNKMLRRPRDTGGTCNFGETCYDLAPGDLATIYDLNPLFNAQAYTTSVAGQGMVIAAVEDTNLYANSDWTTFRSVFGLAKKFPGGKLETVHPAPVGGPACANPGVSGGANGDDGEATLDVEWASAAAPAATIMLASCAGTQTLDPIYQAIQNLVNSASPPPVISVSYGVCEAENGATSNAAFNQLYKQAAAAGISVFVATGDDGPTDCANGGNGTHFGIGVNGWGATQWNVAVGGTDFGDTAVGKNGAYWKPNAGAPWSTAKSYIPEIPWNDTCASQLIASVYGPPTVTYGKNGFCNNAAGSQFLSLGGGEGGPSGCYSGAPSIAGVVSGSCKGYPKPAWQAGVPGIPADGVRDIPDVALFASDGGVWNHNLDTCFTDPSNGGAPCTGNPVSWANAGGTSYATPIMAGIQALIDQANGGAQGNVAPTYYKLAAKEYGNATERAACTAKIGQAMGASCIFHDIASGDDDTDCVVTGSGDHNCYRPSGTYGVLSTSNTSYQPAYKAGPGYDFPTGLGSVDATNLALAWP